MKRSAIYSLLILGLLAGGPTVLVADETPKEIRKHHVFDDELKEQQKREKERLKAKAKRQREALKEDRADLRDDWKDGRGQRRNDDNHRDDWNRDRYSRDDRRDWERRDNDYQRGDRDGFGRPLAATSKISPNDLPPAVRRVVDQRANGARIEDVERGTLNGRTVYEVAFKRNGVHNELRVYENGEVLKQVSGNNMQFPGVLPRNDVPPAVRSAIDRHVGSGEVNDIDRKTVDGRVVYEVGYKRDDRIQREVQIGEDGSVIRESSGAQADY